MPELSYYRITDRLKIQAIENATRFIKVRYGEEIYLSENETIPAAHWIKKYDKKFDNRAKDNNGRLRDCQFLFKLDDNTFAHVQVGSYINSFSLDIFRYMDNTGASGNNIRMYIFGKHYKKFIEELRDATSMRDGSTLYIYDVKGVDSKENSMGIDSIGRSMTRRNIDTLFFNDHIKETICDHIDNFLVNKSIYEEKNLTYKTGILLYGAPGTGKSSLSIALATKYNYNVIVIDMATFDKLDISTLTSAINADSDKYMILLEDIDTLYNLNREEVDKDGNVIKVSADKEDNKVINKMLQFLDSSSSPNDVIFIATTNYVDKLDKAVKRSGRFDLKVEIGNINKETATKMILSFNVSENEVDEVLKDCSKDDNGMYNPAELQGKIMDHFQKIKLKKDEEENSNEE